MNQQVRKPRVGFICTHNSCRSQIAEALGRHLAGDVFESYSAGTDIRDRINPDAVRLMKEQYGIDMIKEGQHNKTLDALPKLDIVVTMGCGVKCPYLPCKERFDWGLPDPTGTSDEEFLEVIHQIEKEIGLLKRAIERDPPHSVTEASQGSDIAEDPWGDTPATLSGSCIQAELPAHGAGDVSSAEVRQDDGAAPTVDGIHIRQVRQISARAGRSGLSEACPAGYCQEEDQLSSKGGKSQSQ